MASVLRRDGTGRGLQFFRGGLARIPGDAVERTVGSQCGQHRVAFSSVHAQTKQDGQTGKNKAVEREVFEKV